MKASNVGKKSHHNTIVKEYYQCSGLWIKIHTWYLNIMHDKQSLNREFGMVFETETDEIQTPPTCVLPQTFTA